MSTTEFVRENRYIVIKRKDARAFLRPSDITQLYRFVSDIAVRREAEGKAPRECVVVEADWPEYEMVWKMIEARMTGVPSGAVNEQFHPDVLAQADARFDNLLTAMISVSDFMRGMILDPAIPAHAKEALRARLSTVDTLCSDELSGTGAKWLTENDAPPLAKAFMEGMAVLDDAAKITDLQHEVTALEATLSNMQDLLREVSNNLIRKDELPDNLLPRIDAFLNPPSDAGTAEEQAA